MRGGAPFPVLFVASAAHGMNHVLLTLYATLVLVLGQEWHLGYYTLIALWAPAAMATGLGSPLSGWLGDKFGETRVLVLCFLGLGASSVLCGLAQNVWQLQIALVLLGLSGSIYHPVCIPWVVKHAHLRGRAIALTGSAGSLGVALGPVVAGALATLWGWRTAFIAPGLITAAMGLVLIYIYASGRIVDSKDDAVEHHAPPTRADMTRVFAALAVTMTLTLVAYSAFTNVLPKLVQTGIGFSPRALFAVGLIAGLIELFGASAQFIGGHFVDRGAAKNAYLIGFILLALAFPAAAIFTGWSVTLAAIAVMFLFEWTAPIETMFVARYTPAQRRGLIFGIRYGLSAVGNPAGVWLIAALYSPAAGFFVLMATLAVLSLLSLGAAFFLPAGPEKARGLAPEPAE
jgi:FSR family fosmidomycin resistance protein-like MFS transporter